MLPHDRQQNFGFDMWKTIFYGSTNGNETWRENGVFPRVTLCDFETRDMGNVQMHTVQCVLLLNLFTEKIFVFLWAWYILLTAFTVGNLFSWLFAVFNETYNEHFILNHLEMCETPFDKDDLKNREHVTRFITLYLGTDGLFLLQLIAQHADVVFTTELIAALFKTYIEIEAQRATLKQMNAVLPLLRPNDESQVESGKNTAPSTSHNVRRRGTEQLEKNVKSRQGSLSTQLRPFNSFEEPDQPTKKFDDSSSEDENSKKGSKKPSPTKKKASSKNSPQSSSNSRRPSLAHTASPAFTHHHEPDSKIPKTAEKKHW
ncbi:Innexin [Caenorhabditis elegans]|nr:Innexin [Caenorhabditis elegans]CDK13474.1 Innexin [Caenorhabditis elegans]|eukprot:NP_001293767.1 Innexin [Caenorhabditis elegans]